LAASSLVSLVGFLRGGLIGMCGPVLTTIGGLSSEAWLRNVSSIRKNFSASMAMTSSSTTANCLTSNLSREILQSNRLVPAAILADEDVSPLHSSFWGRGPDWLAQFALTSGRDIQLTIGMAGKTQPIPTTT